LDAPKKTTPPPEQKLAEASPARKNEANNIARNHVLRPSE
jgi:hypothetical protein